MSFRKIREHTRSLSFRLTLWYAGIFMVSTLLFSLFVYHHIASQMMRDIDTQLGEEVFEFQTILKNGGMADVNKYLVVEVESEPEDTFFRVVSVADGHEVAIAKNFPLPDKKPLKPLITALKNASRNNGADPIFTTVNLPGYHHDLRTVSGQIGRGLALQVGLSFVHDKKILALFKQVAFVAAFPLLILSALIGWFLSRRPLKDVGKVTLTAQKITQGDYSQRVRLTRDTLEIRQLADTFNTMLDRIQSLIKGMKEVTDDVAHDLRSPLARIRGQAEMALTSGKSNDYYRDMAASIIEECDSLIDMINTMLDITEMEAGVDKAEQETVAMNNLIRSACDLFEPVATGRNIKLTKVLPDNQLYLRGDKHKLQRMVTNLIENGIKYNRPGGTVTVTVAAQDESLHIRVEDTGQGISEQALPKIFDRFYRGDACRAESGLGLGLSLAKVIAQAAGGDIQAQSTINQGSCFTVILPL